VTENLAYPIARYEKSRISDFKLHIAYELLLATIESAYFKARKDYETSQERTKERLDKLALEVLGRTESINPEQYQSLADSFLAREGIELFDPMNLPRENERRQAFIEDFKSSVDRVLSISNARTMIEISD